MVDLIIQLIENLNTVSTTVVEVNELLNKDWNNVEINKNKKKVLQKGIRPYVKVAKANLKYYTNCLNRIKYTWSIADWNRFS